MTSRNVTHGALALMLVLAGCSSPHGTVDTLGDQQGGGAAHASPVPQAPTEANDAGADVVAEAAAEMEAGGEASTPNLGTLVTVDVPDTPCTTPGGNAIQVTPAIPGSSAFDSMGALSGTSTRRFAVSSSGLQLVTFDPDGSNPSSALSGVGAAAPEGSAIDAIVVGDGASLALQRIDPTGVALGSAQSLTSGPVDSFAVGVGAAQGLAVWTLGGAMTGRLFAVGGGLAAAADLGSDTAGASTAATRVVARGDGFAIVWTRQRTDGRTETLWRSVDSTGAAAPPITLVLSEGVHSVVAVAPRTTGGIAVLVDEGLLGAVVMPVDDDGGVVPPAFRFAGTSYGLGIATNGPEMAVVAARDNGSALRAIASDGTPLGPWECLDDGSGYSLFAPGSAIDSDGAGYATLTSVANGSAAFLNEDHTGAGL
jgi:hypothetical protein